jgi:pimeloyl-ACP methyl ester carboxylesterase
MPEVAGVAVAHRWVEVGGGVRVHVAEVGEERGGGGTVVLLHGFPQHWYAWRRVVGELAVDHRVLCLDMRGFGWSDAPQRGYDTGTRVADVLAVMDALGVGRARVIAHEFGAWTAFMLCLRAPERVSHLLALNVVHPWPLHRRLLPQAWRYWYTSPLEAPLLGRFVLRHMPGFTRLLLRKGVADPAARDDAAIAEFVRAAGERGRARAGEAMHRAYALRDIPALALGRYRGLHLRTPTRILAGERDFALGPRAVTRADAHADDLTVEVIAGCGHFVHEERPDAVVRAAYELFGKAGAAAADTAAGRASGRTTE